MTSFQLLNRGEIRRSIGRNLGIVTVGAITAVPGTPDTTSVIDTTNLAGADDEHNGKQIIIYDATGSIVDGEIRRVTDYTGSTTGDLTTTAFSQNTAVGDKFELYEMPWLVADINDAIDQAILKASARCLQDKQTETTFTKPDTFLYDCLSGFNVVHMIEHEESIGTEVIVDNCDTVWTKGSANVTVTADTSFEIEGLACAKLVEDGNSAAGAILGYGTISSKDLSGCDKIEISMYSTIALTAGYLDLVLSASAAIAATTESIDIPAMAANTWYRHILTLANPQSDTAIISVGLVNTTDVGACTLYIDYIRAVDSKSRRYKELNPEYWSLVRASTPLLQLTSTGLGIVGAPKLLRISGYDIPAMLTDDSTDSEVDPDYIINMAKGLLMTGHSKARTLDIQNREDKGEKFIALAMQRLNSVSYTPAANTRYI